VAVVGVDRDHAVETERGASLIRQLIEIEVDHLSGAERLTDGQRPVGEVLARSV
jgi:hypothetical protein